MNEDQLVSFSTVTTIVPLALLYGGYHIWRLRFSKQGASNLCKAFRYMLGYWLGSGLYIVMCIIFPIAFALLTLVVYFRPDWIIIN